MVISEKERYEEIKKYRGILLDYDSILLFYPEYNNTKNELEKESFISKESVDEIFNQNYKTSDLANKLVKLTLTDDEIYNAMNRNKEIKYINIKNIFDRTIKSSIELCKLIDYIGHYPNTHPIPNEEEKNKEMEELFEKYDIVVRYHLDDDFDKMQIDSDDIVRIIEKLKESLDLIYEIKEMLKTNDWLFKLNYKGFLDDVQGILNHIDSFPLSRYQEENKSKREEARKYLKLQWGVNL